MLCFQSLSSFFHQNAELEMELEMVLVLYNLRYIHPILDDLLRFHKTVHLLQNSIPKVNLTGSPKREEQEMIMAMV